MPRRRGWRAIIVCAIAVTMCQVGTASGSCLGSLLVTELNLTFHTRQVGGSGQEGNGARWRLDAVGTWRRPPATADATFTGYAAKLSVVPSRNEPFSCDLDQTYNLTFPGHQAHGRVLGTDVVRQIADVSSHSEISTNESITFEDVNYGFQYKLEIRTIVIMGGVVQPSVLSKEEIASSPDCYEETRSAEFCSGRAVQTTGKPIDLRVDSITRQDDGLEVRVSWARPVQSNGAIKMYALLCRRPDMGNTDKNGGGGLIVARKEIERGEWNRTVRYNYTIRYLPDSNEEYRVNVTPTVQVDNSTTVSGHTASMTFQVEEDLILSRSLGPGPRNSDPMEAEAPRASTTRQPRGPAAMGDRLPSVTEENTSDSTDTSESEDQSTTPSTVGPGTPAAPSSHSLLVTASVAVGVAMAFVLAAATAGWVCFRRKKKEDELKKAVFIRTREEEISMYHHKGSLHKSESDYRECQPEFEVKELDRTLLKLEKELGSGQFGVVYKGYAFGIYNKEEYSPVAVKSLKCNACPSMKEDFLDEIKLIIEIGSHPNILSVLGCCTVDEPYYLVTEFMKYGDLLHFLWKCREENRPDDDMIYFLTETNKIQIARQITRGMEYLSNTRYYHGDLAARNILVGEDLVVKISDFGLADDIYQNGYKRLAPQRKRPVKWVSLETNLEGKCTIQSDVWSFGIVLYEIYTLGSMPYPGLDGREVIRRLQTGYRMDKPNNCPDDVYDVMLDCWRTKPSDRPTFTNLFNTFDKMLVAQCDYMPLEGAVYDHCIPTGGSGGIKSREEGASSAAATPAPRLTPDDEDLAKCDSEQSDTARLFQEDEK